MKNKFSIPLLVAALSCAFALIAYAESTKIEEDSVNMELSENEVKSIQEECQEIAIQNGMQGDDLITFVDECFAANTMVFDDVDPEQEDLMADDEEVPVLDDETMIGSEEPVIEDEETSAESTS